jgi:hypothetical protein
VAFYKDANDVMQLDACMSRVMMKQRSNFTQGLRAESLSAQAAPQRLLDVSHGELSSLIRWQIVDQSESVFRAAMNFTYLYRQRIILAESIMFDVCQRPALCLILDRRHQPSRA